MLVADYIVTICTGQLPPQGYEHMQQAFEELRIAQALCVEAHSLRIHLNECRKVTHLYLVQRLSPQILPGDALRADHAFSKQRSYAANASQIHCPALTACILDLLRPLALASSWVWGL